ncbi:MAG: HAD-IB family phosphatase [bacterium]|nr:HAD-IB family phosphatase [bacterium]
MAKRKPKALLRPTNQAVFFDLDGTWLRDQSTFHWLLCAADEGVVTQDQACEAMRLSLLYKKREIEFKELKDFLVQTIFNPVNMEGVPVERMARISERVIQEYGGFTHRFTECLSVAARKCGAHRVLISGALHDVAQAFADKHEIQEVYATRFHQKNGVILGHSPMEWVWRKGDAVTAVANHLEIDLTRSVAIGDSESDAVMLSMVGYPICLNPTEELEGIARAEKWPIVLEFKSHYLVTRPDRNGDLMEESVTTLFPGNILNRFAEMKT